MNPVPASVKAAPRAQVNLLPPEVNEKRVRARMRGLVIFAFACFVVVLAAGYVLVAMLTSQAQDDLAEAHAETQRINQEIANYAEVDVVKAELKNSQSAQSTAAAVEVFWPYLVGTLSSTVPAPHTIKSITVTMPNFNSSPGAPKDAFGVAGVGDVHVQVHTAEYVDAAEVERALNDSEVFIRARVTSLQFHEAKDDGTPAFYELDVNLSLTYDALMLRYSDYWTGEAEGGSSLEDFYRGYFLQMSGGVIPRLTMPPLPPVERPIPLPGVVPVAPGPSADASTAPEGEES